jgi:2'-5' RNA ligase
MSTSEVKVSAQAIPSHTKPLSELTKVVEAFKPRTDFKDTWWCQIPLPSLEASIRQWITSTFGSTDSPSDRITDIKVCKNALNVDPHITVLLGLPEKPDHKLIEILSSEVKQFPISFGMLKVFDPETKIVDGISHTYQVLHIEVIVTAELLALQKRIGDYYGGISWHWPDYHPHITVTFIRGDSAHKYVGQSITSASSSTSSTSSTASAHVVDKVVLRKFQDKAVEPIIVELSSS